MGNLSGVWVIELADLDIGLFGQNDAPRSIFSIDIDETEVTELSRLDWGSGKAWTLIPANDAIRPYLEKRALVLVDQEPHWAYFGLDPNAENGPEILVEVEPVSANVGEDTGTARGRN